MAGKARAAIVSLATAGAVALIAQFEGFRSQAYIPIKDDKITIGYGQTFYANGRSVKLGDVISEKQARGELQNIVERQFLTKMAECVKVPLTQNEFDAYLSLLYNIGSGAFCRSTLVKKLNVKDYAGACSEILRWRYANGRVVAGLERRRFAEYKLCME